MDIAYGVAVVVVVVDDDCVVVFVVVEEAVVLEVVCVVAEVVVSDVVCVVVFTDDVVVLAAVIIVLYVVWVVLLPDEQLKANALTSITRMEINTKELWVDNLARKNVRFVSTLLSNGRYRRFPLCPRDFLRNPPAVTPYSGIQVFSSKSWLIFTFR
jgi:hypothetical protein